MGRVIKHFFHKNFIFLVTGCILTAFYFATRVWHLTIIPIFTDEAIYLRWGQLGLHDAAFRLYSLVDGKQPLMIWLFYPMFKIFSDPLIAGRMASVVAGFFGMLGFGALGWYLGKSTKAGLIAMTVYILSPFFLIYDRIALYDSLLAAITIWALFFSILLVRTIRLDVALLLGMVSFLGFLTKSSAQFFLYNLPFSLILFNWKKNSRNIRLIQFIAAAVALSSDVILRLSPFYHIVGQKNLTFVYSLSEFIADPFKSGFGNLHGLTLWLTAYMTLPGVLLLFISIIWGLNKNIRLTLYLLAWFAFPFVALAFFGRVIYPRFILFMSIPLWMLITLFINNLDYLSHLWRKPVIALIAVAIVFMGYFDWKLLTDPIHAPLPYADRQQFINDWPAGYGVKEAVAFLAKESEKGKIIVGTEGTFGLFPYAFELYLGSNPNIEFRAKWPVDEVPPDLIEAAATYPTYLVFKERQQIPPQWKLKLMSEYQRGDGPTYLRLFQVLPPTQP